jgi:aryl-alcohol dehydrogenase-like predicted oxidoreductase
LELAVTPWGILGAGILTGKYSRSSGEPKRHGEEVKLRERTQRVIEVVDGVAREAGRSPAQVAANWVRQQRQALMIPILGARSAAQLQDNLSILEWTLSQEQMERLDEASQIELGFPHGFLDGNEYIFGNTFNLIDNHRM